MNIINKSAKQNIKKVSCIVIVALAAIMLCVISSCMVNNKAYATPTTAELQNTLDQCSAQYYDAMAAVDEAQAKVNEANSKIEYCNQKIPECEQKIGNRAKAIYMEGPFKWLDTLLGASTLGEFIQTLELISIVNREDAFTISQLIELKRELSEQNSILEENLEAAKNNANEAKQALDAAQAAIDEANAQGYQPDPEEGGGGGGGGHVDPTTGNIIADRALGEQGKPYGTAGVGPDFYDCSGLVSYAVLGVHQRLGSTHTFMNYPRCSPEIGCICTSDSHCGIYIGGGSMCHAPTYGQTVCVTGVQGGMIYVAPPC